MICCICEKDMGWNYNEGLHITPDMSKPDEEHICPACFLDALKYAGRMARKEKHLKGHPHADRTSMEDMERAFKIIGEIIEDKVAFGQADVDAARRAEGKA